MKKTIEEQMKTEYKKYKDVCKNPKSFYDWASDFKARTVKSLKNLLEKWEEYEPKKVVVIKVKKGSLF